MSLSDLPAIVPDLRGYLRNRTGREWSNMDLRDDTPLGTLFDALLDLVVAFPIDVLPGAAGPKLHDDSLLEDLGEALRRWPGKKLKPLCRLMCAHLPKYRRISPDTLRKRIAKRLQEEASHKAWEAQKEPPPSNTELIGFLAQTVGELVAQVEAHKANKKIAPMWPPPIAYHAILRTLLERGKN